MSGAPVVHSLVSVGTAIVEADIPSENGWSS